MDRQQGTGTADGKKTNDTKRRAKGEGSITQRKDGTFQGSLDLGMVRGKRKRLYVYADDKKKVGKKLYELRKEVEQGLHDEDAQQTVKAYVNSWYASCVDGYQAPSTCALNRAQINQHIIPGLGDIQLNQLRTAHIQAWVNDLRKTRCRVTYTPMKDGNPDEEKAAALAEIQPFLSPRQIQIIFGVLRRALNHAVDTGVIHRNPTSAVKLPRVPDYEPRVLTDEEVTTILAALQGDRLEAMYHVLICLGLRRGEALELEWSDLKLEQGDGSLRVRKSKTPAGKRTVPLSDELIESLVQHQHKQQQEQAFFGVEWNPDKLVFPSEAGTSLSGRNVFRHYKKVLVKAGIEQPKPDAMQEQLHDGQPAVRMHDLRHWACSSMLSAGTPIKEVQEIMGHATVSTTLKIYAHVIGDGKRQAINRISQLLKGTR